MTYDKASFLAKVTESREKREAAQRNNLQTIIAVAPVMEKLMTGEPHWDRFLQHIEHMRLQAVAAKTRAELKQRDPMIWDHETMSKLKSDIIAADAYIEAFDICMSLPKALIEDAELAKQNLARFEAGNDKSAEKTTQP